VHQTVHPIKVCIMNKERQRKRQPEPKQAVLMNVGIILSILSKRSA